MVWLGVTGIIMGFVGSEIGGLNQNEIFGTVNTSAADQLYTDAEKMRWSFYLIIQFFVVACCLVNIILVSFLIFNVYKLQGNRNLSKGGANLAVELFWQDITCWRKLSSISNHVAFLLYVMAIPLKPTVLGFGGDVPASRTTTSAISATFVSIAVVTMILLSFRLKKQQNTAKEQVMKFVEEDGSNGDDDGW
jgi:hypothetical protein